MSSPITPLTPEQTAENERQALHESRLREIITAADVFINVATGGKPDMTISSRAAIASEHGSLIGRELSKLLSDIQPDHGARADAGDLARAQEIVKTELQSGQVTAPKPSGE